VNSKHFTKFVNETATLSKDHVDSLSYCALGVASEGGEVAGEVKASLRLGEPVDKVAVMLELGDVTWYVERLAQVLGFTSDQARELAAMKLARRKAHGKDKTGEYNEAARILGLGK
jgi:NTP pyrophosphatase (non-canonical NTP hydrolase)